MTKDPFDSETWTPHTIPEDRAPCVCGSRSVRWTDRNGQRVAYCTSCSVYVYAVPGHEIGAGPKKNRASSPETVDKTQRARILLRDRGACALCRTTDGPMEIGHLVSVAEGRRYQALKDALGSDANLALMCRTCNSDIGSTSVTLLHMTALHLEWSRLQK